MMIDHDPRGFDDTLSELDQQIVGTVCRIEIPMRSPSALLLAVACAFGQHGPAMARRVSRTRCREDYAVSVSVESGAA